MACRDYHMAAIATPLLLMGWEWLLAHQRICIHPFVHLSNQPPTHTHPPIPLLPCPCALQVFGRWYRPPELLMGSSSYGCAVDMWAAGCVLAEMLLRRPWFPGSCDMDQLDRIFKVCTACWGLYVAVLAAQGSQT